MATTTTATAAPYAAPKLQSLVTVHDLTSTPSQEAQTIDSLVRTRALEDGGDKPIVAYPSAPNEYVHYTPRQLDTYASRAAAHYAQFIPQRLTSADSVQVIGLLGPSHFEYLVTLLALTRLGHTVLFLSTRISEDAYASLIEQTEATTLLVDSSSFESVASRIAAQSGCRVQPICERADFDGSRPLPTKLGKQMLEDAQESSKVAWIIHSSGSTGLPKPIFQTHSAALRNYANNFGFRGFITLPLYHAHGISCLFRSIYSRKLIYMYGADLPLTASHLTNTLEKHDIQILYAVPYALKLLAESEKGIAVLSSLQLVMFGGSACPKPIGDKLTSQGVLLVSHYGTTETGQLMTSFRDRSDKDWDFVRPSDELQTYLAWEEQTAGSGIYELIILDGWPSKVMSNRPDKSYATKDLFEKHPTTPNAWRYYARLDDTLVLENGEKANPLLLEGVARENRNVAEAIVFGAGKPYIGMQIIPSESATDMTNDEVISSVWPAIESANQKVPAFSQLSRDMINVLPRDASYRKTDKGTILRAVFYRDFKDQIEAAYVDSIPVGTKVLDFEQMVSFLREGLLAIINSKPILPFKDTTDLFSLGIDSLQSLRLRALIQKELDVGGQLLAQNFVFENPSLAQMANEIIRLRSREAKQTTQSIQERMAALIEKYGTFAPRNPGHGKSARDNIVLTGATGSLGAHVAAELCSSSSVGKVYCLVRARSTQAALQRIRVSMQERRVFHTLPPGAFEKIVPLPAVFSNSQLGLDDATYNAVAADLTGVIHCAWSVNFSMRLESFENDCIAATRHLLDLCLASKLEDPARFVFCSSVSTVAATPGNVATEDLPESLLHAQNMGYAQSKLVTEHVCRRAAAQTGMSARVVRVGQIIADTKHGIWNATEAIPLIFQSALSTGVLPSLDETPSWTPVDIIAASVIEAMGSDAPHGVINLTNPTLFHWTDDLLPFLQRAGLKFNRVSQREWIARLRKSNPNPSVNPSIKLLDFFIAKYDHDKKGRKLHYETSKAVECAPTLATASTLSLDLVEKFYKYFSKDCWGHRPGAQQTVVVIAGPCGTGKTTIAHTVASAMDLPVVEGDDVHTPEARERMGNGIALTDHNRWDWLDRLRETARAHLVSDHSPKAVLVTCSALRVAYRDSLRKLETEGYKVRFLLLRAKQDELQRRMALREDHYMGPEMVPKQVALLEEPLEREVDVAPLGTDQSMDETLRLARDMIEDMIQ